MGERVGLMVEQLPARLPEIITSLRVRFWFLNPYYEAAWTDSWCHRHCLHAHGTLIDAAKMRDAAWCRMVRLRCRKRQTTGIER